MNKKIHGKSILLVARSEYVRWLVNPKIILLAVVFLPMRDLVVTPMLRASGQMASPINGLEPCIAMFNNWVGVLLLALVYMILISSFPTMDGNMLFYIARMGRRNWILGEMLFQCMSVLTYSLIATLGTLVQVVKQSFFSNGWSLVVTDYDELYGGVMEGLRMKGIIQPNLYFQMTPFRAYFFSVGLFSLFLLFCGMLFVVGCLYHKRLLFFFLQVSHISIGCGVMVLLNPVMWLFPVSHSFLCAHYQGYFREYIFSPWLSLELFCTVILVIGILMYRRAQKVSLDQIGGDVLL